MNKIDPIRAKNKWSIVIENMGYTGNKMEEISVYAENHSIVENLEANIGKIGKNFLPVAMKIISKLKNLDNVNFKVVENSNDHQVNIELNKEEIIEHVLKNGKNSFNNMDAFDVIKAAKNNIELKDSMDYIQKIESSLIDKAVEKIDNAIASLLSENSEVFFETSVLVKDINVHMPGNKVTKVTNEGGVNKYTPVEPVSNELPTMNMTISYNLKSKQNEPKKESFFIFLKEDKVNGFDYVLHDKSGDIFFARKGDDLHTLNKYENIKYKLDELCKTLTEHEAYNYEIIEKLRF